jgi:hypothetical protein
LFHSFKFFRPGDENDKNNFVAESRDVRLLPINFLSGWFGSYYTADGLKAYKEALFSGPAGGYDDNDEDLARQGAKVRRLTVFHSGNSSEVIDIKHVIYPDGSTRAGCQIAVTTGWIDVPPIESQPHAPPPPSKQDQPINPQAFAVFDTGRTPHQFQRRHGPKRKR